MAEAAPSFGARFALKLPTAKTGGFLRRTPHGAPAVAPGASAEAILAHAQAELHVEVDRLFAALLILQWIAAIVLAFVVSPYTWIGAQSRLHEHVWAAILFGGALTGVPIAFAQLMPGATLTRHVIAVAQMMWSALLIHLTGGRIETHFHVFGSLAFLAFYQDWRVIMTATVVVAADHFIRGVWYPLSVFGVATESYFRWIEHAAWVVFEDVILIRYCLRGRRETRKIAEREALLFAANDNLAAQFQERARAAAEVRRLYEDLSVAHEEVVAASQVKSQFLANMSHELRTPLNAIIGYSELLQVMAQRKGDATFTPDLQKIEKSGQNLLTLINDILDFSKLEAGKMEVELQSVDVEEILSDIQETIQPLAARNANELTIHATPGLAPVHADAMRLKQCLLNLLSNACKFTQSGRIDLAIEQQEIDGQDVIVFNVIDTGVGLSPEQADRLFQPFSQADASTTRKFGGTGLGLSITKSLCEAMGGTIGLESALGAGSTFTIKLPAATSAALCAVT